MPGPRTCTRVVDSHIRKLESRRCPSAYPSSESARTCTFSFYCSEDAKAKIKEAADEAIEFLDNNADAEVEEMKAAKEKLEKIVHPIISKLYEEAGGAGGAGAGSSGDDEEYDEHDEL